jgi:hypothetical protein
LVFGKVKHWALGNLTVYSAVSEHPWPCARNSVMKWKLTKRRGQPIASGTLEQMLTYLKYTLPDGEYRLIHGDRVIRTTRHQGILIPFDQWEGSAPMEVVNELQKRERP